MLLPTSEVEACPRVYRPRRPKGSALFHLVEECYEDVKGVWEERYEAKYGRWRGFVDETIYAFSDCGDLSRGFARVYCDACRSEYLLAFSCARRGFCPSCAAKRAAIFGAFLQEEIVEDVGHLMWTFTVPKLLRPFFLHRRRLLGQLCRAAWETVAELVAEAAGKGVRPGMVTALHSAASDLRWHPHVHALGTRGGWDRNGIWHPVPYVDEKAAELLFRQRVLSFLDREGLLGPDRLELLDSWKSGHTGFSAHNRVTVAVDDTRGLERLARYLLRPALSLERLELDGTVARYRHKQARRAEGEAFDAGELLARLLMHLPEPRLHLVRCRPQPRFARAAAPPRLRRLRVPITVTTPAPPAPGAKKPKRRPRALRQPHPPTIRPPLRLKRGADSVDSGPGSSAGSTRRTRCSASAGTR